MQLFFRCQEKPPGRAFQMFFAYKHGRQRSLLRQSSSRVAVQKVNRPKSTRISSLLYSFFFFENISLIFYLYWHRLIAQDLYPPFQEYHLVYSVHKVFFGFSIFLSGLADAKKFAIFLRPSSRGAQTSAHGWTTKGKKAIGLLQVQTIKKASCGCRQPNKSRCIYARQAEKSLLWMQTTKQKVLYAKDLTSQDAVLQEPNRRQTHPSAVRAFGASWTFCTRLNVCLVS